MAAARFYVLVPSFFRGEASAPNNPQATAFFCFDYRVCFVRNRNQYWNRNDLLYFIRFDSPTEPESE